MDLCGLLSLLNKFVSSILLDEVVGLANLSKVESEWLRNITLVISDMCKTQTNTSLPSAHGVGYTITCIRNEYSVVYGT